jgi:periplasmic protein TonB
VGHRVIAEPDRDPLARVMALGGGVLTLGSGFGSIGAVALHVALAVRGASAMFELGDFARRTLDAVVASLPSEVDVDMAEPDKPPEPEPEPEPEVREQPVVQRAPEPQAPPPPEPPAPAAAQAGEALTAEPDPDEPVDMTNTIVTGPGTRYAGGITTDEGTSQTAVRDTRARGDGPKDGTGKLAGPPPPPPPPPKSQARAPLPESRNWNCGFPAEADMEQVDRATVMITVTVGPDGRAKTVSILKDPGFGFGRLAKSCALRMRYNVGLDAEGRPMTKTTPPFPVHFTR